MKIIYHFLNFLQEGFEFSKPLIKVFGIFGMLNYPVFYIFWQLMVKGTYEDLNYRLFAALLCFGLVINESWPVKIKKYLYIYWYATILYCIPFFGTFMLLKNNLSQTWLANYILGLFWLILILDVKRFIVILLLGIILSTVFFLIQGYYIILDTDSLLIMTVNVIWIIITSLIFCNKLARSREEKLQAMKSLAGTIAHEMRTPLNTITTMVSNIKTYLPLLIETYKKDETVNKQQLLRYELDFLHNFPSNLEQVSRNAFIFIDMLLVSLKDNIQNRDFEILSMKNTVSNALDSYPLSVSDRETIKMNLQYDYEFKANKLLFTHVIYNLLKNSIYYIKSKPSGGEITIWTEPGDSYNTLYFKDTGTGIAKSNIAYIFDNFYSTSEHGTGIGLSFCKMVINSLKGSIECYSRLGEYSLFVIKLPKLTENN